MKRILILLFLWFFWMSFFSRSHVFANDIENAVKSLWNSIESRFKKPGFDLRNNMLVGDSNDTNNALIPGAKDIDDKVNLWVWARDVSLKDNFLGTIQNYLFTLVGIVAIAMFIYTGFKLFTARGDEKEYSQAWKAFAYTVVGLVVIPLAFVLVKIVLWFTF